MSKEVTWLYAPCVVLILKYLTIMPRTPMQLRRLTKIPHNYVNVILKRLVSEGIVKCLTPQEKIGKIFCINPASKELIEKVLKESGYNLKARFLPELNWKAYGRLGCGNYRQIRGIFDKAVILNDLGIEVTEQNLEKELRTASGVLEIDRSDIYRALRQLKRLGLVSAAKKKRRLLEYELTKDAIALVEFLKPQ